MALTGRQFGIAAGNLRAVVVEVGAGLRSFTRGDADVTFSYGEHELPPRGCGSVLVPWPNRLRAGRFEFEGAEHQLALTEPHPGNAIHGLGRWARWSCAEHTADSVTMALDIPPQTGWPFEVLVQVTYTIDPDTGLTVTTEAANHGTGPAPFGAGFHPYLAIGPDGLDEVVLRIPADRRIVTDDAQIPTGTEPVDGGPHDFRAPRRLGPLRLDDGFTGLQTRDGRGAVELHSGGSTTELWFDDSFGFLQLFTPDVVAHDRTGVAVEPMTCAADAFNSGSGLIVLEPGGTWTGSWGVQPR